MTGGGWDTFTSDETDWRKLWCRTRSSNSRDYFSAVELCKKLNVSIILLQFYCLSRHKVHLVASIVSTSEKSFDQQKSVERVKLLNCCLLDYRWVSFRLKNAKFHHWNQWTWIVQLTKLATATKKSTRRLLLDELISWCRELLKINSHVRLRHFQLFQCAKL